MVGVYTNRQPRGRAVEEFKHARAGPVDIGAILEDDVDERHPEKENPRTTFDLGTVNIAVVSGYVT